MVTRQKRLLVVCHVIFDGLLGMLAFALAYAARFEAGLIAAPKGQPPFEQYLALLPLIGLLAPFVFNLQGPTGCDATGPGSTISFRWSSAPF